MSNEVFYPEGTSQQRAEGVCHINTVRALSALAGPTSHLGRIWMQQNNVYC